MSRTRIHKDLAVFRRFRIISKRLQHKFNRYNYDIGIDRFERNEKRNKEIEKEIYDEITINSAPSIPASNEKPTHH